MEPFVEDQIDFLFFFSRFCAYYGVSDTHVMNMSLRRFWGMSSAIDRIEAQKNLRDLTVANSSQSLEGAKSCRDGLIREMGTVYIGVPVREEGATNSLKDLMM